MANSLGYEVAIASEAQDKAEHWDVLLDGSLKVDVKAMKAFQRGGDLQDKYICVELHGAKQDIRGWLYGSRADIIAFQTWYGFLLVWRKEFIKLVESQVDMDSVAYCSSDAVKKVYNRKENEWISWIERKDIESNKCVFQIWSEF